jgi:hypothetical protein
MSNDYECDFFSLFSQLPAVEEEPSLSLASPFFLSYGGSPSLSQQNPSSNADNFFTPGSAGAAIESSVEWTSTVVQGTWEAVELEDGAAVASTTSTINDDVSSTTSAQNVELAMSNADDVEAAVEQAEQGITGGMLLHEPAIPMTHGQAHDIDGARSTRPAWRRRLIEMRSACSNRGLDTCRELRLHLTKKTQAQKEALIRFLHIARADGLLITLSDDAERGRWAAFRVVAGTAGEFMLRLLELFGKDGQVLRPNTKPQTTIDRAFGNLGYRPNGTLGKSGIWEQAYCGLLEFVPTQ